MTNKITIDKALLEQAIDTLGYYAAVCGEDDQDTPAKQAQAALRAALADPAVEQQILIDVLKPLVVDTIKMGKLVLKAKQGITLEPATDETKQLICVTHADLGIDAFARTRDALVSELNEQIGMLWQEYALAADDDLDGMAIKMKQALLAAFSEVAHGA